MRDIWLFVFGSFYSLAVLLLGIVLGYIYGAKEDKINRHKARLARIARRVRSVEPSASIPHKTQADAEAEERKPFTNRFAEIVGPATTQAAEGEEPRGVLDI